MFRLPGLGCKNPNISHFLPYLFTAAGQSHPGGCLPGFLSLQKVRQMKQNSQLLGCAFFSVDNVQKTPEPGHPELTPAHRAKNRGSHEHQGSRVRNIAGCGRAAREQRWRLREL